MYGRVLYLNFVKWENDWFVIGEDKDGDGCGEFVKCYKKLDVGRIYFIEILIESDEFNIR